MSKSPEFFLLKNLAEISKNKLIKTIRNNNAQEQRAK